MKMVILLCPPSSSRQLVLYSRSQRARPLPPAGDRSQPLSFARHALALCRAYSCSLPGMLLYPCRVCSYLPLAGVAERSTMLHLNKNRREDEGGHSLENTDL